MRYTIRRIGLGSALRVGCALGWVIALCPAIGLAWLAGQVLQRLNVALTQVEPFDISVFNQPIARIDVLETLRLRETAGTVGELVSNLGNTVLLLALALVAVGALAIALTVALFSLGYNLLAKIGGGIQVDLRSEEPDRVVFDNQNQYM